MELSAQFLLESVFILEFGKIFFLLLAAHFVGDFLCQSREVALNKTKELKYLLQHGFFVGLPVFAVFFGFQSFLIALCLSLVYAVVHCIQDFVIWRTAFYFFGADENYSESKSFYTILGFDQFLHVSFLLFLYVFFT